MNRYTLLAARYPALIAEPLYIIAFAPVPFTLSVGLAAVLVTVNLTVTIAPVTKVNPVRLTVLAAVPAAVEQVP